MSPAPLRIALLGYRGNPYSGGQGIYLKYLSRALSLLGHQVTVIGGQPYADLDPNIELVKLPSLDLYSHPNHVTALRPRHMRSRADTFEWWSMLTGGFPEPYTFGLRLQRWWRSNGQRFDVVHDNQSLCYALLKLQRKGVPVLATIHHPITWDRDIALNHAQDDGARLLIRRWHNFLRMQTRVASSLRQVVTVSENSKRDICDAFNLPENRVAVVHNGIDMDDFRPQPCITRESRRLISTASADQPLKGSGHLVLAFSELRKRYHDLQLTIIGRPKPGGPTAKLIDQLQLTKEIEYLHGLTTDEIRALYARSTIAIVPSEYEGFGLPAGEAMACGVPLVSTDGGALPEVVGDAGVIVPVADPIALAAAIGELLENDERRTALGNAGRERIRAHFSWDRAASEMTELYSKVMQS